MRKPVTSGSEIKKNIESVLSKKYGGLNARNLFNGIDDKDVEDNIQTAENTIRTNIDRGVLSKSALPKLPNLRDGLALSYAAADKGNSRAATRAREAAYMEKDEPLVKKTETKVLPTQLPKMQSTPKATAEKPLYAKLMGSVEETPKTTNPVWKPGEKANAENLIYNGKKPDFAKNAQKLIYNGKNTDFTDNIQKLSNTTEGTTGIRFKAMMDNQAEQDEKEESVVYTSKNNSSGSFYDDYVEKRKNHHVLLPADDKIINQLKPIPRNEKFSLITPNGNKLTPSKDVIKYFEEFFSNNYNVGEITTELILDGAQLETLHKYMSDEVKKAVRPNNIGKGAWEKQVADDLQWIDDMFGKSSKFAKALKLLPAITIGIDTARGIKENVENKSGKQEIISDAVIDIGFGAATAAASAGLGSAIGTAIAPGAGTVAGIVLGILFGYVTEEFKGKSLKERADTFIDWAINGIKKWFD